MILVFITCRSKMNPDMKYNSKKKTNLKRKVSLHGLYLIILKWKVTMISNYMQRCCFEEILGGYFSIYIWLIFHESRFNSPHSMDYTVYWHRNCYSRCDIGHIVSRIDQHLIFGTIFNVFGMSACMVVITLWKSCVFMSTTVFIETEHCNLHWILVAPYYCTLLSLNG